MKILITVPYPDVHGPLQKTTPTLIEGLRSLGCSIGTEPWERHGDKESFFEKVSGRLYDVVRISLRLRREPFYAMLLQTAHDWGTLTRDILLLFFSARWRPATVVLFHGSRSDWLVDQGRLFFKLATRALLRLTDAILVLSQEEANEWCTFFPQAKVHWVSNAFVSQQNITPKSDSVARSIYPDAPVLLIVSRLMVEKGIFDLLDALAIVKQKAACHLMVAGDGPEKKRMVERIRQLGLKEHVTLTGYLSGDELAETYRRAHVFVLPTYWAEGFPTVISEAMDAGLPIVTTKLRGMADHLVEGRNALFVPVKAAGALAETLLKIIADSDLRAKMSRANQADVKKFLPDIVATEYVRAIQDTTKRRLSDA